MTDLLDNSLFLPGPDARPALTPFAGTLVVGEQPMGLAPAPYEPAVLLGRRVDLFPAVRLAFATCGPDLVPATQEVLRRGSASFGRSYWDILVQPGRVWSEPGDGDWSHASFPFALMHSLEGETHNGVMRFRYRPGAVADLRFQIVQQTAPFLATQRFTAAGSLSAAWDPAPPADPEVLADRHRSALEAALPLAPWSALEAKVGAEALAGFDSTLRPGERVLSGLCLDGVFYLHDCPTLAGSLPYWERQRFGVWSVTKAAANAAALLRLAEKYGPEVAALPLADFLPEAPAGWSGASFGDALDMATGLCSPVTDLAPDSAAQRSGSAVYSAWYEAPTTAGKLAATLRDASACPWRPGEATRYRDEDMFLLGVAMQRFLESREGAGASLWRMLEDEVYGPLGIRHAPINRTLESPGQPLMAYGYYPTVGELVQVARLFQQGGRWNGRQILSAALLADILPGPSPRGLPTGDPWRPFYRKAFWHARYESRDGGTVYFPLMLGWGENVVALFPGDIVVVRLANNLDGDGSAADLSSLAAVADRVAEAVRRS